MSSVNGTAKRKKFEKHATVVSTDGLRIAALIMECIVHLEVLLKSNVNIQHREDEYEQLRTTIIDWLLKTDRILLTQQLKRAFLSNGHQLLKQELPENLVTKIAEIHINVDHSSTELENCIKSINDEEVTLNNLELKCYFYKLFDDIMCHNFEEDLPATFHTFLPSKELDGLWESLIFDSNIRLKLLNYVKTSLMFAKQNVNPSIITWNKVILLHGPPGTGKTSLCKALAHKISIRLANKYQNFQLIEINSHSLFSKWFSESGKLVLKLFDCIREFAEDRSNLIFVLIDEVESLAYDRQRSNNSDPSDAIRVVNALLTQMDSIRKFSNVIILASSNVTEAMDNAFVDRADIKQYIGMPSECAVYKIYHHCIQELIDSKIIACDKDCQIFAYHELQLMRMRTEGNFGNSENLLKIVKKSSKLSGRALRKLPFLAIALYSDIDIPISLTRYLECLSQAVEKQLNDNQYFNV